MNRTLGTVVSLLVVVAIGSTASAALINYYSFNASSLVDDAPSKVANGGATATNLTLLDPIGSYGVRAIPYDWVVGPDSSVALHVQGSYHDYFGSQALEWPTSDPDVDLGADATIEMWIHSGLQENSWGGHTNAKFVNGDSLNVSITAASVPTITVTGGAGVSVPAWPIGSWDHVALVVSGGAWTYYYNGVSTATGSGSLNGMTTLKLGTEGSERYAEDSTNFVVDNIAMWNEALSQDIITVHAAGDYSYMDVPEPASMSILILGGVALLFRRRRA